MEHIMIVGGVDELLMRERANFDHGIKCLLEREITNDEVQRILGLMMIIASDQEAGKAMASELGIEWLFTREFVDNAFDISKDVAKLTRDEYGEYSTRSTIQYAESMTVFQPAIEAKLAEIITRLKMPDLMNFMK